MKNMNTDFLRPVSFFFLCVAFLPFLVQSFGGRFKRCHISQEPRKNEAVWSVSHFVCSFCSLLAPTRPPPPEGRVCTMEATWNEVWKSMIDAHFPSHSSGKRWRADSISSRFRFPSFHRLFISRPEECSWGEESDRARLVYAQIATHSAMEVLTQERGSREVEGNFENESHFSNGKFLKRVGKTEND